jgi:LmbE family N-acetylglucosaminyl deacetylase
VSTIVSFHAHPDDEAILCGGTLAKAVAEGHRVVLVTATTGQHGEVPANFLDPDETLGQRRAVELAAAASALGVARLEILGYVDSGMRGTPTNEAPEAFWQADIDEAAGRLVRILLQEGAEVLTIYDDHGVYGHPDHIQVHRVGIRAGELAATPYVFEATFNRDHMAFMRARPGAPPPPDVDGIDDIMGLPEVEITTAIDVSDYLDQKRAAMRAHPSQISEGNSPFLTMSPEIFRAMLGTEWYRLRRRTGAPKSSRTTDLFHDSRLQFPLAGFA